jgi:hypothetical protein
MFFQFKFMVFLWQLGIVDTWGLVNYFVNVGAQYGTIVIAATGVKHFSEVTPKVLLEPISGIGVSLRYIKAGETVASRRAPAATIAALLTASAGSAATSTPAANSALGGAIARQIETMRSVLATRGGNIPFQLISQSSLENSPIIYVSLLVLAGGVLLVNLITFIIG